MVDDQYRKLKAAARERKRLRSELAFVLHALEFARAAPVITGDADCDTCTCLMADLAELKSKYVGKVDELDACTRALEEMKARPILLGACPVCPMLRKELEETRASLMTLEKSKATSPTADCDAYPALIEMSSELRVEKSKLEEENTYLRAILSWVSSREPHLGMMIHQFKRGNGFGVGHEYTQRDFDSLYGKIGQACESSPSDQPSTSSAPAPDTKDGVFTEPTPTPPKSQVWIPKPNILKNPLDTLPPESSNKTAPKPQRVPQPPPQPKRAPQPQRGPPPKENNHKRGVRYHYEFCHRDGHLAEFCFRRRHVERREREFANLDMYHQPHGDHAPRRWDMRVAEPRRVGGGRGDGRGYHAPMGGRFFSRAPHRRQYGGGPCDRGFEHFDGPRFDRRGDRQDFERHGDHPCYDVRVGDPRGRGQGMIDSANPFVKQMA